MTAPIEDVSSLPGKKITDQAENPIGKVKEIYATDGYPMWVAVELSSGIAKKRTVFIPLARIKDENGDLRVPYSVQRIGDSPEVDDSGGISAECDRELRDYYGIDAGDQELRTDNNSYATLVREEVGESERVENADELDTPDADTRTDESHERLHDPGSAEMRQVSADDVAHNTQGSSDSGDRDDEDRGEEDRNDEGRGGQDRGGEDRGAKGPRDHDEDDEDGQGSDDAQWDDPDETESDEDEDDEDRDSDR